MKISPQWLREFVNLKADDRKLAEELTHTGTAVESISQEHGQSIFEMEITTNRVDCMNHYGIARECSAVFDVELKPLKAKLPAANAGAKFPIEIQDKEGCARYTTRTIRGVNIGASQKAVAERLAHAGASSINNAVDASNYVLIEMGHPTHAFDLDLLAGGKIIVRRAHHGEMLKTLDGVERKLHPDDLVIADAKKPVALAGVMGGFDTMITEKTKNILIESAWFEPAGIRRTARRHGMHTDASHRFERGADFAATPLACARVAELIFDSAGGDLTGPESDAIGRKLTRPTLTLRTKELLRHLGQVVAEKDVRRILSRLAFAPKKVAGGWQVTLPSWRLDVEREIDLVEEIARIYGYNNFKNTLPAFSGAVVELPKAAKDAKLRSSLLALGYDEAVSMTFVSMAEARQFSSVQAVELANPLSEETTVMRTSLVPGMLAMLGFNLNRGTSDVRLFESGHVFEMAGAKTEERGDICLGATGNAVIIGPHESARPFSFYDLKGDVETVLENFQHGSLYFDEHVGADYYRAGYSARAVLDGATVARLGQLLPEVAAARKLKQEIFIAEFFLDRLYQHDLRQARYQPISRYPAVERDFSFIFPAEVTFARIREAIQALGIAEMKSLAPADMLRGKAAEKAGLPAGKYSLLLRVVFQSAERTLRDDEVAGWSQKIVSALQSLGGTLRS
jgi:phenylalanyl-tRNA synthetase beta chain